MSAREHAVADGLLALETELRRLGWWESSPPTDEALASQQPFCIDTLSFSQWLQWVFIPAIKHLLEGGGALPDRCAITEMGEVAFAEQAGKAAALLKVLRQLDQTLSSAG